MIEFTLSCDDCGRVIVSSKASPATARTIGRLTCGAARIGRRDLCSDCIPPAQTHTGGK
jgi:hypothetical protein